MQEMGLFLDFLYPYPKQIPEYCMLWMTPKYMPNSENENCAWSSVFSIIANASPDLPTYLKSVPIANPVI